MLPSLVGREKIELRRRVMNFEPIGRESVAIDPVAREILSGGGQRPNFGPRRRNGDVARLYDYLAPQKLPT